MSLDKLPYDIWEKLLQFLSEEDFTVLSVVSNDLFSNVEDFKLRRERVLSKRLRVEFEEYVATHYFLNQSLDTQERLSEVGWRSLLVAYEYQFDFLRVLVINVNRLSTLEIQGLISYYKDKYRYRLVEQKSLLCAHNTVLFSYKLLCQFYLGRTVDFRIILNFFNILKADIGPIAHSLSNECDLCPAKDILSCLGYARFFEDKDTVNIGGLKRSNSMFCLHSGSITDF